MPEFLIEIQEQEIEMFIGLHEFEKVAPQRVVISVQILTKDVTGTAQDFVDYDAVTDYIRGLSKRVFETQEDLVLDLHGAIMQQANIAQARVSSRKPDVYPDCAWVGLSYPARPIFSS